MKGISSVVDGAADRSQSGYLPSDRGPRSLELSIVIPNYNHAGIISRAIASALSQRSTSFEVIVVNDGSTDDSADVLRRIEQHQSAVRVINHERNGGAPKALNTGLHAARGEFISFLGADDFALPTLYSTMIEALRANPDVPLACGEMVTFDSSGRVLGVRPMFPPTTKARNFTPDDVRRLSVGSDNWICNTVTVYRRTSLLGIGGFDESLGAFCDGFLVRRLAFRSGFFFVPGIVGGWQVAPGTLSASSMLGNDENKRLADLLTTRLAAAPELSHFAASYAQLYQRRWRFATVRTRFVWKGAAVTPAEIIDAIGGEALDLRVLSGVRRLVGFGRSGRVIALAWLCLRMRPVSLPLQFYRSIRNRLMLRRCRRPIEAQIHELEGIGRRLTVFE